MGEYDYAMFNPKSKKIELFEKGLSNPVATLTIDELLLKVGWKLK